MEQCYFSFMLFGRYFQLTKAKVFQVLAKKDGWKIVFKIDFKKKKSEPEKVNNLYRCRRLRYPTLAMAERIEAAEKLEQQSNK